MRAASSYGAAIPTSRHLPALRFPIIAWLFLATVLAGIPIAHAATAGSAEGGMRHQISHGVDAVVRSRIEFMHIERRPTGDLHT